MRVVKPSGSIFVNLGDKYSQRVAVRRSSHQDGLFPDRPELVKDWKRDREAGLARMPYENVIDRESGQFVREKSLMLLPERYRIGCVDRLGLIARAVVIWDKPNGLPESVTDRVRRSHEDWVHLTKLPRYYAAMDEVREPHAPAGLARRAYALNVNDAQRASKNPVINGAGERPANELGKLPGSVWRIATEPLDVPDHLGVDHFAAFPTEWPRRIIAGWSPAGICTACDEGRRPVSVVDLGVKERDTPAYTDIGINGSGRHGKGASTLGSRGTSATITGYACACPSPDAPTRPSVVLDPFGGTGTTALCASVLGRIGISGDLSHDYSRLASWRTTDPGQRAKAMRVEKPPVQIDGQYDMFGDVA